MSALFWLVIRWIAAVLIGIAVGSVAASVGFGWLTMSVGALAVLLGSLFVFASIWANYLSPMFSRGSSEVARDDLVGPGLLRATLVGFLGTGVLVGSLTGNLVVGFVSGLAGGIVMLFSLGVEAEERRPW